MELLNSILYDTVYHSAPIILCVIGGIFAYKANVLNIALEGMMLNGAFISVLVEYLTGSVALAVIAAIVTTLLWGLVFSFLGITCNGNVIVIGLGINLIVPAIAKFVLKVMELANISLQDVGVADFKINIPGIKSIPLIGGIVSGHPVITYLAFIGIAAAAILMYKTKFGIYVRVVGENEDSAISLGLKTQKYKYIAVLIGAFCCALAGINLSMERMAMFTSDMTAGRGFIAIAAIYCGQGKPVQSSLYAILFGVARSLAVNLSVYAGPAAGMFDTIPYIIMVAVLAVVSFMKFKDVKVMRIQVRLRGRKMAKTALIIVDMVRDFTDPEGLVFYPENQKILPRIKKVLDESRKHELLIVFLQHCNRKDKVDKKAQSMRPNCIEGTFGIEIDPMLEVDEKKDYVIRKRRYSGFFGTDLDLVLRENEVENVVVVGTKTNCCIRATVTDAFYLNYNPYVIRECVATNSETVNEVHLTDIDKYLGKVIDMNTFSKMLEEGQL